MDGFSLGLIVVAALLHASWNLASKRAADAGVVFVFFYRLCSVIIYLPWVLYILHHDGMSWSAITLVFIGLSTLFHLAYSLSLMRGYQVADLSVVYPVARGTGPLLASAAAVWWLHEPMYPAKAVGIGCVVIGILLIATQGHWRYLIRPESWAGVRWGLLIGTFIAGYSLVDAYGVKVLLIAPVVLDWISALGGSLLLAPRIWASRESIRRRMSGNWMLAVFVGAVSPLAYILILYALQRGAQVSQVAPLREMSMIVATLIGAFILKEKISVGRGLGCIVIFSGVLLISLF